MSPTLRRSCTACYKYKHSCDLRTPRCSRCIKRKVQCVYANQPLTAPEETGSSTLSSYRFPGLDPFDSYPLTRLPRERVQRLIHSFLHKIAFQYYPLDLNATTNPFLISWWPLALGDPALFHVSLQTACLDEELLAQKGFQGSEILMTDSVSLLRRKIEDQSLAVQDGTMNSVITLAAIEFGKGNVDIAMMHINGVKKLVTLRGGISSVRQTSPLTARMISWVSMIVTGCPQFETQDDVGVGDGIPPIPEWQFVSPMSLLPEDKTTDFFDIIENDVESSVQNVFIRLRNIFQRARSIPFPPTHLHDLTCFVIHRLLLSATGDTTVTPITECIRYATILYMFIVHGPTYYSHAVVLNTMVTRFVQQLKLLDRQPRVHTSLDVWFVTIGMVAATGTDPARYQWFLGRASMIASGTLQLWNMSDAMDKVKRVLWFDTPQGDAIFRPHWDVVFNDAADMLVHRLDLAVCVSSSDADEGLLQAMHMPNTLYETTALED
ncbi:Zn(II)2Cys6 transcription factor [Aspergillus saccharolyticus JOP 1030-1]|uniref:Zn(2)-C6 fungal-type domain-containing protein n=1 Tax=Aspergillus saccharolyticus JOP 1030-1 TaxID=1450539 RepID=A0A318ZPF2_9EURO|nr:hypothetical protein BP01DRAFT_379710 [Aspergillus saccharolyticus JOP 1030-1]PYH48525.1 hypothetical protein BP01DRAFT_379710 [Aspergillus saccharolyticus JOP 1030-1]